MFDWDRDFDDVTTSRPILPVAPVQPPGNGRIRRALRRGGISLATALMLGVGVSASPGPSALAVEALRGWVPGFEAHMPEGLRTYDQSQFVAFRRGIAGFSNAELLDYERVTMQGHLASGPLLADFTHDALVLTHQEIQRRGLARPVSSLRLGDTRVSIASPLGAI